MTIGSKAEVIRTIVTIINQIYEWCFCFSVAHDEHDKKCEEFEKELAAIREDLVDSINAW
jgi:hypothetical protein